MIIEQQKKKNLPVDVQSDEFVKEIQNLIAKCNVPSEGLAAELVTQLIQTSLRLLQEEHSIWQMKLINRALKEMRYAYNVFNQYPNSRCISIFGSARTPETHIDYLAAKEFSVCMSDLGWMCITGAANGIMKAATEGAQADSSFGLSIHLPFEPPSNTLLERDPKLMIFRYFFTRKLMFIGHADAVAAFPGGVGTMDELFEVLTLMQTGKANIMPLVLIEGKSGKYWKQWSKWVDTHLLKNGWISQEDKHFYYIAKSPEEAKEHILKFYRRYHSSRYVKDLLVIRLNEDLNSNQLKLLNKQFSKLIQSGQMELSKALSEEHQDHPELPRLVFKHTRKDYGLLRAMIDQINDF